MVTVWTPTMYLDAQPMPVNLIIYMSTLSWAARQRFPWTTPHNAFQRATGCNLEIDKSPRCVQRETSSCAAGKNLNFFECKEFISQFDTLNTRHLARLGKESWPESEHPRARYYYEFWTNDMVINHPTAWGEGVFGEIIASKKSSHAHSLHARYLLINGAFDCIQSDRNEFEIWIKLLENQLGPIS